MGLAWIAVLAPRMSGNGRRDNRKRRSAAAVSPSAARSRIEQQRLACGCSKSNIRRASGQRVGRLVADLPEVPVVLDERVIEVWSVSA